MEDPSLELLTPAPDDRLYSWLNEFYGYPVEITQREVLRHRDLSYVERIHLANALPETLIYKLVLPPWDIEQDLHERVLIPSISNSARLFLSAHLGELTALFIEDLGTDSLLNRHIDNDVAQMIGRELAKLHRAYSYRIDELMQVNVLRSLLPLDYEQFTVDMLGRMQEWNLVSNGDVDDMRRLAGTLASNLAGEPVSLVHGDMFAENILLRNNQLFIIDWSWFTVIGIPAMDLATLTSKHHKNGSFFEWRDVVLDAYCFESGREPADVQKAIPFAETLGRLMFLHWLVERRQRGITGTTVGHVDTLIPKVVQELNQRLVTHNA